MKLSASLSKLRTALGGFVLTSLMVGFLCISFVHSISAHRGMSHAVHTSSSAMLSTCCDAGVSDHMELWKSTLVGIPENLQSLFVLFAFALVASFTFSDFFRTPRFDTNFLFSRYRQYAREHPDIGLFDPLRLAFARGILNPKLF